jgi:arylsulfatase A-like enzyme
MDCARTTTGTPRRIYGKSKAGEYGDFVTECDATVQQIVQALKEMDLYENTIIILTSDNGCSPHGFPIEQETEFDHNTSNGFKGRKSHSYDGGHRVSFIVTWPRQVKAGRTSGEVICSTDLYATVAELLEHTLTADEALDSYSFLSVLKGEGYSKPVREATIHHSINGHFFNPQSDWKYIVMPKGSEVLRQILRKKFRRILVQQVIHLAADPSDNHQCFSGIPGKSS